MDDSDQEISDNSVKCTNKRQRELSSDEEILVKKSRNSTDDESPISNRIVPNLEANVIESDMRKEITQNTNLSNSQENISSPTNSLPKDDAYHTEIEETNNASEKPILNENTHVDVMTSRTKGTEVVDGLELSVECASDKEESSSESEDDYNSKPRTKTIIVKEKSSESEDNDTDNDIENNDNEENESKHTSSDNKTSSENESDNNNADKSKDKKGKRDSTKPKNEKRIEFFKKCLRTAGISARLYQKSLRECKTNAAKMRHLKSLLEEQGISGRPTLKKCQKVKMRNERLREVSELDKSNIISEGRLTRSQSVRDPKNTTSPENRSTYKRIKIIDSDSE